MVDRHNAAADHQFSSDTPPPEHLCSGDWRAPLVHMPISHASLCLPWGAHGPTRPATVNLPMLVHLIDRHVHYPQEVPNFSRRHIGQGVILDQAASATLCSLKYRVNLPSDGTTGGASQPSHYARVQGQTAPHQHTVSHLEGRAAMKLQAWSHYQTRQYHTAQPQNSACSHRQVILWSNPSCCQPLQSHGIALPCHAGWANPQN